MKKPWSITTTTRSPYRLKEQLRVLADNFAGLEWTNENQIKFQISLIQHRLYGHNEETGFSQQFLKDLSEPHKGIFTDFSHILTFEEAADIFGSKNYKDPSMRGRQSFNPFKKFGFVRLRKKILEITPFGENFLSNEYNLSDIFFSSFIKWQLPNPDNPGYKFTDGYNINPFIGTLHLIRKVNELALALGEKKKGISKSEFSLFGPSLVNFKDVNSYAKKIIALRQKLNGRNKQEQKIIFERYKTAFAKKFLQSDNSREIRKLLKNLKDYGDNAIRYFRLTNYISIRGSGFYIDIEPRRSVEVNALLDLDNAQSKTFTSKEAYFDYISDISQPQLPWETKEKYIEIVTKITEELIKYETVLGKKTIEIQDYLSLQETELKTQIAELRKYRRALQDQEAHRKSQDTEAIKSYIQELENIFNADDKPILLEKLASLGLHALNDSLKIQPNYPVGDDNEPTFTAPANTPDIECFYKNFNAICEVTMLVGRDQWYNEGQPVMRHLRDFENKYNDKNSYCLFIAPKIHRDTINTFWNAVKYEYEGKKQKIIPLSIDNFISLLNILIQIKSENKFLKHNEIFRLYDEIVSSSNSFHDSNEWSKSIPTTISSWQKSLTF